VPIGPSDVAIIGIGALFPKTRTPDACWANIIAQIDMISEIPLQRWDWRLYFDPDPAAPDKVCSKWGGFLDDIHFDPLHHGIPPATLNSIDPLQLLTLEVARQALEDAGYAEGNFDRINTSIILGVTGSQSNLALRCCLRREFPRIVSSTAAEAGDRLPKWIEDSSAGLLPKVTADRVADHFDLGGAYQTVDAADASSLAVIELAVNELESGQSSMVIAGGMDTIDSALSYLCYGKILSLSPSGVARPFDQQADGIVIGEGIGVVIRQVSPRGQLVSSRLMQRQLRRMIAPRWKR